MTPDSYRLAVTRSPNPPGWDAASLAEFDRRWLAGETILELTIAFACTTSWVTLLRLRRGLPTRRDHDGVWRGGNRGVRHQPVGIAA